MRNVTCNITFCHCRGLCGYKVQSISSEQHGHSGMLAGRIDDIKANERWLVQAKGTRFHALLRIALACIGVWFMALTCAASELTYCHLNGNQNSNVKVTLDFPVSNTLHAGDPIPIRWHASGSDPTCRTPLYLVISFSERVRFEGNGFLAIPVGASAPYKIGHRAETTRVFVPLHNEALASGGSLRAKFYTYGKERIDWALVEIPKLKAKPQSPDDYAAAGAKVLMPKDAGRTFFISSGKPNIGVRDQYTTEQPQQTIKSLSGEFVLEVYKSFYRILDAKTGALMLEREGWKPNFSPSSRFLGAYSKSSGFEVWDLYSGSAVLKMSELAERRAFEGIPDIVAWSPGDTFFVLSIWGWGGIHIQPALVDTYGPSFNRPGCHACRGYGIDLSLDQDAGIAVLSGAMVPAVASLVEERKINFGENTDPERQALRTLSEQYLYFDEALKQHAVPGWKLGEQFRVSHACAVGWGDQCTASDMSDRRRMFVNAVVDHSEVKDNRLFASAEVMTGRGYSEAASRSASIVADMQDEPTDIDGRFAALGLTIPDQGRKILPLFEKVWLESGQDEALVRTIVSQIPRASANFQKEDGWWKFDSSLDEPAQYISPAAVEQIFTWTVGDEHFWMLGVRNPIGGASTRYWLHLLRGNQQSAELVDFFYLLYPRDLRQQAEKNLQGLSNVWLWPGNTGSVRLIDDRYILSHGTWGISGKVWVLLYDLQQREVLLFKDNVDNGGIVKDFFFHGGSHTVIQLNTNGELVAYKFGSGTVAFRGYEIDDEVIVYTDQGYYASTPEGAQFVFLRFPGVPGYQALSQFPKLHRPDILRNLLTTGREVSDPVIETPPLLLLEGSSRVESDERRKMEVGISAFAPLGVASVRFFVDGFFFKEAAALNERSESFTTRLSLDLPPQARYLTAVAIGASGNSSTPQAINIRPMERSRGRLLVVAVGTDSYADPQLSDLALAKSDARLFATSAKTATGYYGQIETTLMLDDPYLRNALPDRLRAAASKSSAGDTIMLFAAGHGLRDGTGRFYLATSSTDLKDAEATSLPWEDIAAAFKGTKARVIIFLDACHSGSAGGETNDDAVAALLTAGTSLIVVAAAKGRQNSLEDRAIGGGLFTSALKSLLSTDRAVADANGNGTLELSELYGNMKRRVMATSSGRQTPWIARNQSMGEVPLF